MLKRGIALSLLICAAASVLSIGIAAEAPADKADDEKAIRDASTAFVKAFNRQDAKAIGAMWTEDGTYIDESGILYSGRKEIVEELKNYFAENKGRRLHVHVEVIQFATPDVAVLDGISEVDPPPEGAPVAARYSAVRVRRDGKWLLAAIRETTVEVPSNYEHLKPLEWMVGDWLDKNGETSVRTSVRWSENKNFLVRKFTLRVAGRPMVSGTQRIGWDPERQQIKSWVFDSEGSVTEGLWIQDGNRWVVRSTAVLRDGSPASATRILTKINDDTFTWQSVNRVIGDENLPDLEQVTVVRVPPTPM
jgi:uncharacterized protein (TIGR02246 family)